MSNEPCPPGFDHIIAHLAIDGAAKAIDFYKKALGAEEQMRMPAPDGRIMHACLQIGKSVIFLADEFPEYCNGQQNSPTALKGTSITLHQYVPDCDAAIKKAADAGATVIMPAADMFWGDRYGMVQDPFGHRWTFGTRLRHQTPEETQAAMEAAFREHPAR